MGNAAACLCFGLAVALRAPLFAGGGGGGGGGLADDLAVAALSPVFLLLSPDTVLLRGLTDRRRYLACYGAVAIYLAAQGWARLAQGAALAAGNGTATAAAAAAAGWMPFYVLRNGASLLMALANHVLLGRFLWDHRTHSDAALVLLTPLSIPPLLLTDLGIVRLLAGLGLGAGIMQFWLAHGQRAAGLKYI